MLLGLGAIMFYGCGGPQETRIAFLMDYSQVGRWKLDSAYFVQKVNELGAVPIVASGQGSHEKQMAQAKKILAQQPDVLFLVASHGQKGNEIVRLFQQDSIPVVAYDRLIVQSPIDYYISFDNQQVGYLQASYLTNRLSKIAMGAQTTNFLLLAGPDADPNARMFRQGQLEQLEDFLASEKINLRLDITLPDWQPQSAYEAVANYLDTTSIVRLHGILAANDAVAKGAIQAVQDAGLGYPVVVSGQDAELEALKRIKNGQQTMTVYKSIKDLASTAAIVGQKIARQDRIGQFFKDTLNLPGSPPIRSLLLTPVAIDTANLYHSALQYDSLYSAAQIQGL